MLQLLLAGLQTRSVSLIGGCLVLSFYVEFFFSLPLKRDFSFLGRHAHGIELATEVSGGDHNP